MEAKINIAEILESKSQGTKLYSLTYGGCFYQEYTGDFGIEFQNQNGVQFNLDEYGKYCIDGESIIFPSKEMRDWRKFAWKKGDVLVGVGQRVIFEKFIDENYTKFQGKYSLSIYEDRTLVTDRSCYTSNFSKINDSGNVEDYFKDLEEKLGGKFNRETLEIEKAQPEFKDGDIVALVVRKCTHIAIFQSRQEKYIGFHAVLCQNDELLLEEPFREDDGDIELRLATEEEKKQLFSALEKEGKAWDAEKKQIVELKPKVLLKPFDKVLCRDDNDTPWKVGLFSHIDGKMFQCVGSIYRQCIPYEGNEHLLGTTKDVED